MEKRNFEVKLEVCRAFCRRAVKGVLHVAADGACGHVVKHPLQVVLRPAVHGERYVGRAQFSNDGAGRSDRNAPRASGVRFHRHAGAFKRDAAADVVQNRPFARDEASAALAAVARDVVHGGVGELGGDEKTPVVPGLAPRKLHEVAADFKGALRGAAVRQPRFEPVDHVVSNDVGHVAPDAIGFGVQDSALQVRRAGRADGLPGAGHFRFGVVVGDVHVLKGDGEGQGRAVRGGLFPGPVNDACETVGFNRRVAENSFGGEAGAGAVNGHRAFIFGEDGAAGEVRKAKAHGGGIVAFFSGREPRGDRELFKVSRHRPVFGRRHGARPSDRGLREPPLRLVLYDEVSDGTGHRRLRNHLQKRLQIERRDCDGHVFGVRAFGVELDVGIDIDGAEVFAEVVVVGKSLRREVQRFAVFHRKARFDVIHLKRRKILRKLHRGFRKAHVCRDGRDAAVVKGRPDFRVPAAFFQELSRGRAVQEVRKVKVREAGVGVARPRAPVGRRFKKRRRKARSNVNGIFRVRVLHGLQAELPVREPLFKDGGHVGEDDFFRRVVREVDEANAGLFDFQQSLMQKPFDHRIAACVVRWGAVSGRDRDAAHFPGVFLRESNGKVRVRNREAAKGGGAQKAAPVKGGAKASHLQHLRGRVPFVGFRELHAGELKPRPERLPARTDGVNRDLSRRCFGKIGGDVVLEAVHLRQQVPAREKNESAEDKVEDREAPEAGDDIRPHPRMPQEGAQAQRQNV